MNSKKTYFNYFLVFVLLGIALVFLSLHFRVDGYEGPFLQAASGSISDIFSSPHRDPAYSFLMNVFSRLVSFEVFAAGLIILALGLKMFGLLAINPRPVFLDILPYVFLMSLLHEAIQIRAAIALSIVLWAMVYFVRNQKLVAVILVLFAATFHVSVLSFLMVFLLLELFDRLREKVFYVGLAVVIGLSFLPSLPDTLMKIGVLLNSRHIVYIGQVGQNKTGLFSYFYLFVAGLTFLVWYFFQPNSEVWKRLYRLAITSGCLAFAVLLVFHFSVNIASRLADVLIFPVVLVLGALLVQLKEQKRYLFLSILISACIGYGVLRGFVSFTPHIVLNLGLFS